ncbi:hypothetical protein K7432_015058 [Basidiobolus ranarum]|uniref:Uncharacterized protein n=1 Tax=Basidiobolus ranarum TaxID=34480 RepID=A0ABR2VNM0_9FUNG
MVHMTSFLLSVMAAASYTSMVQSQSPSPLQADINLNRINAMFHFEPMPLGVQVTIDVSAGLSKGFAISSKRGFEYSINISPVEANNDCTATGGKLDPANVGAAVRCNPAKAEQCQQGDLSGKISTSEPCKQRGFYLVCQYLLI